MECTFGILKKRWRILNNGLEYRDIHVCEKIFVTCCCLHNFLLDQQMERGCHRVGRGCPIGDDGIFLDGHINRQGRDSELGLSLQFGRRRSLLSIHLKVFCKFGNTDREEL